MYEPVTHGRKFVQSSSNSCRPASTIRPSSNGTDGSRCEDTVGASFYNTGISVSFNLRRSAAYAMMVSIPNLRDEVVILTDTASCLQILETGSSKHPCIQETEYILRNKNVWFNWIPRHAGIIRNYEADRMAYEARQQPVMDIPIPGSRSDDRSQTAPIRYSMNPDKRQQVEEN